VSARESTQPAAVNDRLGTSEYIGYALGDTASNFFFQTFNIFLTYFAPDGAWKSPTRSPRLTPWAMFGRCSAALLRLFAGGSKNGDAPNDFFGCKRSLLS